MNDYCVVDTDVVSYMFKDNAEAQHYRIHLVDKVPVISFMTLAELRYWALKSGWGLPRTAKMEAHLQKFTIYSSNNELCQIYAQVIHSKYTKGRVISVPDAWIAATAIQMGVPLITNNRKDFEGINDLTIISKLDQQPT